MAQPPPVDPADWVTIWQSEVAALAVDREAHERVAALARAWAAAGDAAAGCAGPDATPGPAPGGPASELGRDLDGLRQPDAGLERATP